jgi:hypothetical protein
MHRTQFEIREPDGTLLDIGDFIDCPDLADTRIANCLKYYPDATVTRTDDPDWYQGKTATAPNATSGGSQ